MLEGKSPRKEGSGSGGSIISQTPSPIRKDPNEEFFMMTFLSYKLNHKEYEKILAVKTLLEFIFIFRLMVEHCIWKSTPRRFPSMIGLNGLMRNLRRNGLTSNTERPRE